MKQDGHEAAVPSGLGANTPGPWKCIETEFGDYQTGEVAFVVSSETAPMVSSVANCRLIAAAPDLLEALRELEAAALWMAKLVNISNKSDGAPATEWDAARQAIDKGRVKARALMRKVDGTETSTVAQDK